MDKDEKGIFQDQFVKDKFDYNQNKIGEQMQKVFYPMSWREAQLDLIRLWFINEVKTKEDYVRAK